MRLLTPFLHDFCYLLYYCCVPWQSPTNHTYKLLAVPYILSLHVLPFELAPVLVGLAYNIKVGNLWQGCRSRLHKLHVSSRLKFTVPPFGLKPAELWSLWLPRPEALTSSRDSNWQLSTAFLPLTRIFAEKNIMPDLF